MNVIPNHSTFVTMVSRCLIRRELHAATRQPAVLLDFTSGGRASPLFIHLIHQWTFTPFSLPALLTLSASQQHAHSKHDTTMSSFFSTHPPYYYYMLLFFRTGPGCFSICTCMSCRSLQNQIITSNLYTQKN